MGFGKSVNDGRVTEPDQEVVVTGLLPGNRSRNNGTSRGNRLSSKRSFILLRL